MNLLELLINSADPALKLSQFADLLITCHNNIEFTNKNMILKLNATGDGGPDDDSKESKRVAQC
jgi:hypothetical protein